MSVKKMASLVSKFKDLELCLDRQLSQEVGYGQALREAIASEDCSMEVEVLKSLGDLRLEKAKLSKDSAEFDKAAALYAAALLRCKDPDVGETVEHRIRYMEKLSRQLLQGYSPHFRWLSPDYWGTADSNVLRVAEICDKLDNGIRKFECSIEQGYTEALVTAIENSDMFLELEVLKSLGDFYLEKGKTTSDVSQFSKAAAMYNKALTTCGGPETKLTLEHRVKYAEKTKEAASRKPRRREERLHRKHQLGNIRIEADKMQAHHLQPHIPRNATESSIADGTVEEQELKDKEYTDHLQEGDSSLGRSNLDSAEQHFAAALKMVHVRDPTAQQYQREVEPLCKLGDVYSKRGQQTGDGGDLVKAVALYNAAIARSEDQVLNGNIATTVREVEKAFLKCILEKHSNVSQDDAEKHKKQLKEMRDQIKLEMETIDQQLDPYVHDEDDPCVKEIEAKRAQAVRQLFDKIAQQRKEFISLLVEECIGLMGPPPCKYALIGLGSQATGLVTPYSDLEFVILVEEESEECLVYFRNLTHYLHLKVVNLGETILPALGIKSLNDFYSENPLDNWYYDSVTPRGFAFDGSMPKASKTPLGRQGTKNKPPSELICTPQNMVSILQNDVTLYLKEGYHLATILRNPCLIAGDQDLIDTYMAITEKILQADGGKMAKQLAQETRRENINAQVSIKLEQLIDVKKEIYRFPALAVDCLALSSGIIPTTVWKTIEEMEKQQVISPNNAHHLTVLTSISAELRLRTYMANGGQKENLSALAAMETAQHGQEPSLQTKDEVQTTALKQIFYLPDENHILRYYYTALPLSIVLSEWCKQKVLPNSFPDFYDTSATIKAVIYTELCKYRKAISYCHQALKEAEGNDDMKMSLLNRLGVALTRMGDNQGAVSYLEEALSLAQCSSGQGITDTVTAVLLENLGAVYYSMGDYIKAKSYLEDALLIYRSVYDQGTAHNDIGTLLNILGATYQGLGDCREAISYLEQALHVQRSVYGENTAHPDIASSLNNLGMSWNDLSTFEKARNYLEQALEMRQSIFGHSTAHADIAISLSNLGKVWHRLGDYRKAISYHEQALQMHRSIYGQTKAHPNIATSLNSLGLAWDNLGKKHKAISYYEQALQMNESIYSKNTPHPGTARILSNIGAAWDSLGDHRKSISYLKQALQKKKSIYGQNTKHPDIANSLIKLGQALVHLGDYLKAISYLEQALQMYRSIYGHTKDHRDIALSLSSLGIAWYHLGDFRKAISYLEQALQMNRSIYGQSTENPDIAASLVNLGQAHNNVGDYRLVTSYLEPALQMCRSIYGQTTPHPYTASSLNNLGTAWSNLGDHRKAIQYYEQALQMLRCIYGQDTPHPQIAILLNNIGQACNELHDYKKAISYHEQALQMFKIIYGETTEHRDIAGSLNNQGTAWGALGDYRKAISYCEQGLQMRRSMDGQTTEHPNIATSLGNLGTAWYHLGDYRKAISYHEQVLQMRRSVYGQTTEHHHIAMSLHMLGLAWSDLGDHRKAISYHEQALQVFRSIYGQTTSHPEIATSLTSQSTAWYYLGDYRKAQILCQEALAMKRQIYHGVKHHPSIQGTEQNLRLITAKLRDNT
ncbi:uncharacterized protein LOC144905199 isoform X1 [Branchiostoma floridae x Branchiostoma belcheri]